MKIEKEILKFHPLCQFEKLQLSKLQAEYLAGLRNQESISQLVLRYLNMGWLVDFSELYKLIHFFALNNWILNPIVIQYFQNIKTKESFEKRSLGSSSAQIKDSKYSVQDLLKLPFFRSLQMELSEHLLSKSYIKIFKTNDLICNYGEVSRDLFVILKGEAAIYKPHDGHQQFVGFLASQSVFGEAGFFLNEKRSAHIVALQSCEVLVVPYQAEIMDHFLNKDKASKVVQRFWIQHALLKSDFFKNFPSDCLDALTFLGQIKTIQNSEVLFSEGQISDSAYILVQGHLDVLQKNKIINRLHQGAFLGEVSLMLNGGMRSATVISQGESVVVEFSRNDFYNLLSQNLYLANEMQTLAQARFEKDQKR